MGDFEPIKLDLKDKKILFELDFHSRESNSVIAKKVGLSKQGVDYRIRQLEKKDVITGYYPIINLIRFGYVYGRFFNKLQNLTQEKERKLKQDLVANSRFKWIIDTEGNYDLLVGSWTNSLKDFKAASEFLIESFGEYIKEKRESIGINIAHFQSRYLLGRAETEEVDVAEGEVVEIDEIDKRLLKVLAEDARMPVVKLAARAKVTAKIAAYRIKRMEKEKIILGYRPNIDHNLLGFTHYKIIFYLANVTEHELRKFKSYLKQLPEVLYLVEQIGIGDVDVEIMLPSTQSLFEFIDRIKFDFPTLIKDYELIIMKKTLKINYLPF